MDNDILLSIIIPVYNTEKYVEKCLDSIITTKMNNYEIIIVNDGSTDNSLKICEEYKAKFNKKNIIIINSKNKGVSNARNIGINIARGKYIMFIDSDDILDKKWEKILYDANNYKEDIIYYTTQVSSSISKKELMNYIVGYNEKNIYLSGPISKLFKTDTIKDKIYFNRNIIQGEDMIFNIEALISSKSIKIENFSFYKYRVYNGSSSRKFNSKIIESEIEFLKKIKEFLTNKNSINPNAIIEHIEYRSITSILYKLSFSNRYREVKKYYNCFNSKPFNKIVNKKISKSKKEKVIFFLIKRKQYLLLFLLSKLYNKRNSKKDEGYFYI